MTIMSIISANNKRLVVYYTIMIIMTLYILLIHGPLSNLT